jgi:O-antigen ligase
MISLIRREIIVPFIAVPTVAVCVISILFSQNPSIGWYGLVKFFEYLFLAGSLAHFFTKRESEEIITRAFSLGILLESILTILQFFHQGSIGGIFYLLGERFFTTETPGIANASIHGQLILRPYGTFPHPNVLAGYLLIAMLFVMHSWKRGIKNKLYMSIIFSTGTIALFMTLSRVAIIYWFISFFFICIFSIKRKKIIFSLLCSFFFIFIILLFPLLRYRFFSISLGDESIQERILLTRATLEMIRSHPFFGVGLYNYFNALPNILYSYNQFFIPQPVHNIFLLFGAETGLIGLGIAIGVFVLCYMKILKREMIVFPLLLITALTVLGMFDHYFLTIQQGQILFSFVISYCLQTNKVKML